jgi:Guanylate kinase
VDGTHYHFSDRESIMSLVNEGKFVEWAEYSGNIYGTSVDAVEDVLNTGKVSVYFFMAVRFVWFWRVVSAEHVPAHNTGPLSHACRCASSISISRASSR